MRKTEKEEGYLAGMKGIRISFGHVKSEIASVIQVRMLRHLLMCEV